MGIRRLWLSAIILLAGVLAGLGTAEADEWVPGYVGANGVNVPGYWRSDGNPANNYSNLQNVNPYTARPRPKPTQTYNGYVDPDSDGSTMDDSDQGDGGLGDGGDDLGDAGDGAD